MGNERMLEARSIGIVSMPEDNGFVRRFHSSTRKTMKQIPTLSEAAALAFKPDAALPPSGAYLRYYGPAKTLKTFSYYELLNEPVAHLRSQLENKLVFVGLSMRTETGPAQKDSFRTPYWNSSLFAGVEIQATAALNIIQGRWIQRLPERQEILLLTSVAFIVCLLIFALPPQWACLTYVIVGVLWAKASYTAFHFGFFLPGLLVAICILPIAFLVSTLCYYFITHRSQLRVEHAFRHYVAPEMARAIRKDPKLLELGGDNVWATAFFSDIAGFTEISESMLAPHVSQMLNAYFSDVMGVITKERGTVVKFIGDGVFALWGAPAKIADHADASVRTALLIQSEADKFNASKRFPPLHTRIGIHSGQMVVGNLGSNSRFDFTAIGDTINLASRIEGANKRFGTSILISETTKKELKPDLQTIALGAVRVTGKKETITLYTIFPEPVSESVVNDWANALRAFSFRRWEEALALLDKVSQADSRLAKSAALYRECISAHKENPPDEDWRGEITFSSK